MLRRVAALELGPHGIRVNAVNPTVTMTSMGRMAWSDPAKADPMLAKIPLGRCVVSGFCSSFFSRVLPVLCLPLEPHLSRILSTHFFSHTFSHSL